MCGTADLLQNAVREKTGCDVDIVPCVQHETGTAYKRNTPIVLAATVQNVVNLIRDHDH